MSGPGKAAEVPLDPMRKPHRAVRRLVAREGTEAPRMLYWAFDLFNAVLFGGQLGAPLVLITPAGSPRALGDYCSRDAHGLQSRIRIGPHVFARGLRQALRVLLHEMVHAWMAEIEGDREPTWDGHGPKFAAKCNELGARLGFPEVSARGRGGRPDCAQWPHLGGPFDDDPPPPEPKARRAPAEREEEGEREPSRRERSPREPRPDPAAEERRRVIDWVAAAARGQLRGGHREAAAALRWVAAELERGAHLQHEPDADRDDEG